MSDMELERWLEDAATDRVISDAVVGAVYDARAAQKESALVGVGDQR